MSKTFKIWISIAVVYVAFFVWYTDLGGKLEPEEIEVFMDRLQQNSEADDTVYTEEEIKVREAFRSNLLKFMEADTGRQFIMVNILDMNENPGNVQGAEPGETADQLMGRYMEHMYPELLKRASHPVFMGNAVNMVMDVVGIEGAERWDRAALMRYKSRRTILEIATNPKMRGKHIFKIAALEKTIAYPVETVLYLSDLRLLLALVLIILGLFLQNRVKR